jgi:hypothetical protein
MAVPHLLHGHYLLAVGAGTASGAIGGISIAWLNGRGARRLARQGIVATNLAPIQERQIDVALSQTAAIDASVRALLRIPKLRIVSEDEATGQINARVGATFESFGEIVTVVLIPVGVGTTRVTIRSEPRVSTTSVDYGKAVQNVETFVRLLRETASAMLAPT